MVDLDDEKDMPEESGVNEVSVATLNAVPGEEDDQ